MIRFAAVSILACLPVLGETTMARAAMEQSPIALSAQTTGDKVELMVTSRPSKRGRATYSLDVDGASTIRQKGAAQLSPDAGATLVRVLISSDHPWTAKLHVTSGVRTFDQTLTSADHGD